MACPICVKRPPKRFCPAKADTICAVCCGTEREVTIDCPSDCSYLIASRKYDESRREFDWSKLPFPDTKIPSSFAQGHVLLLNTISYAICEFARQNPPVVDSDAIAALQALAESYRTLASGIYYERPPETRLQRELYSDLKTSLDGFRAGLGQEPSRPSFRDSEIRDALIFFTQLGATRANGRPKGRAFLDLLRSQFHSKEFSKPASNLILLP